MRWLIALLFVLPLTAAQTPQLASVEQPHATLADEGLTLHFASAGAPIADAESPVIRYALNGGSQQEVAAAQVGHVKFSQTAASAGTRVYAATVPAAPGDVVTYSGGAASRGFTQEHTVAVPPAHTLRFAAAGDIGHDGVAADGSDSGTMEGGSPPIRVRDMIIDQEPDLMVVPGDLAYDNSLIGWDRFMRMYSPLQATIPMMPSIGNHEWREDAPEIGYGQFLAEYVLPGDEHDFLFRAGPVTFLGLNSDAVCKGDTYRTSYGHEAEPCPTGEPDMEKLSRIEGLLSEAENDTTPWTVVYMHHPPFSWGRHGSDFGVRALWEPLFDRHGVDLVVAAHDHLYSRSYPVLADETVTQTGHEYKAGDGVVHIVVGGGGRALYDLREPDATPPEWFARGGKFHHAMLADVDNETMSVQVLALNGTVVDSFSLHKTAAGPTDAVEPEAASAPALAVLVALVLAARSRLR